MPNLLHFDKEINVKHMLKYVINDMRARTHYKYCTNKGINTTICANQYNQYQHTVINTQLHTTNTNIH